MKLSEFNFELPSELIAKYPLENRDDSRLMVVDRSNGNIEHHNFRDIIDLLRPNDVLVVNNTKVAPCYLKGKKDRTSSSIGVLLLNELNTQHHLWDAWIDPARKIRVGNKICFSDVLIAEVIDNTTSRGRTIKFSFDGDSNALHQIFAQIGSLPVIKSLERPAEAIDRNRYHTIYAEIFGSISPPFAGFHFTPFVLKSLELKDVHIAPLTLHIGVNAFNSVEAENFNKYKIYSEYYNIPKESAEVVNKAKSTHKRVCVVGTSTLKAIESSISYRKDLQYGNGWTNNLICPPYQCQIADMLIMNFPLYRSVDFINFLAFAGPELAMEICEVAIEERYRFHVYGDALLMI